MNKSVLTLLVLLTMALLTAVFAKTMMMPRGADVVAVAPGGSSAGLYDINVLADEAANLFLQTPEVRNALTTEGVRTLTTAPTGPIDVTLSVANDVISAKSKTPAGAVFVEVLQQNPEIRMSARAMGFRFNDSSAANPATPSGK